MVKLSLSKFVAINKFIATKMVVQMEPIFEFYNLTSLIDIKKKVLDWSTWTKIFDIFPAYPLLYELKTSQYY